MLMLTQKKITKICIVIIFLLGSAGILNAQALGDVNNSGVIDIVDALLVSQYYVGLSVSNFNSSVADVDGNYIIDIVDALLIAQYYVGLITQFPGGSNPTSPPNSTFTIQAEDAYYNDAVVETEYPGYTGSGYVNTTNESGVYLEWSLNASNGDNAQCIFTFANGGSSARPMEVRVNGNVAVSSLNFQDTGTWEAWTTVSTSVYLNAGSNSLRITALSSEGAPNLDKLDISFSGTISVTTPAPTSAPTATPTPAPTSPPSSSGAEVTLNGSTWTATVNGSTVYTGNRMFDAVNACINSAGSGTVNIRNSGDSGPGKGDIYAIKLKSNITLDFHNNTINCNGDDYIVPVQCDNSSNVGVRNLRVTGRPRYGLWFRTCNGITLDSITMNISWGLGIRVDDSKGGWSYNLTADNINITGSSNHAFETYGVDGISIGTVNATDVGYCGVLLNNSRNATVGTVNGIRCNPGGGYAAFRCANNNGPNIRVNHVYARGCGRGFFSVSGSTDCTINSVDIADCTDIGIWIQDSTNTHVNSGVVANNASGCWDITGNSSGSSVNVTCR